MSDCDRKPTHTFNNGVYNASQVRLYGIHSAESIDLTGGKLKLGNVEVKGKNLFFTKLGSDKECLAVLVAIDSGEPDKVRSIGIIYGYAYEGHCYDLPKPAIMLLPVLPEDIPDNDCGYDKKKTANYKVWIVDKLQDCMQVEVSRGFVEQLVLEANMPGRRSPSTYRATMQVAHRSGRLTE